MHSASRLIPAGSAVIYQAFAEAQALERWLPPRNMAGRVVRFDFREGGSFRMRLIYKSPQSAPGKTSEGVDEFEVRLVKLKAGECIEQEVQFDTGDEGFFGTMRMVWTFQPKGSSTLVTVRAENVPAGISQKDHESGMNSSLEKLAAFVLRES